MKYIFIVICIILTYSNVNAQSEIYNRATIYLETQSIYDLGKLGIDITEGLYKKNVSFTSDFSNSEIKRIKENGFRVKIDIADVSTYYKQQNSGNNKRISTMQCSGVGDPVYPVPANFSLGSMAGYFTYSEMLNILDNMATLYPNLISIKQGIAGGTSVEGEPIYFVKISDNPNIDEPEPEVLYTALHHAREPGGLSNLIFYMWYLLENYQTNPEVQAIVNNTELYFVPCVNPDGYLYNEFTDPAGGGMWRKNRINNLDGTFGVDLNRNYGYNWGFDNFGSSSITNEEVYRGTGPFSEPETQLLRDFTNSRNFITALNYHTFGNVLIYPWGFQADLYTPDSAIFTEYGNVLTRYNQYSSGTVNQNLNYIVNGSSDDWMYGEQTSKPKVLAFTPEVGNAEFGFWPPDNEIIPICQDNMWANLMSAKLAGKYIVANAKGSEYLTILNGYLNYDLRQLGADTTGAYTITLQGISSNVTSTGIQKIYSNFHPLQSVLDSISYSLANIQFGDTIRFLLSVDNGLYTQSDTVLRIFGNPNIVLNDSANVTNNWSPSTSWDISTDYFVSPPSSFTDSPFGDYMSNDINDFDLDNPVSLSNASTARLEFYARWNIERGYDYAQVQVSNNNGVSWVPLCGKYTKPGSSAQFPGEPIYDGFQNAWVLEEMNLDDYIGQSILIRFEMVSDNGFELDGFYFDDLKIYKTSITGVEDIITPSPNKPAYPNPVSELLTVPVENNSGVVQLDLYNVMGEVIQSGKYTNLQTAIAIDVHSLSDGLYTYKIIQSNLSNKTGRFAVKH